MKFDVTSSNLSRLILASLLSLCMLDSSAANELSPPRIIERVAPDFIETPVKSSFSLPAIKLPKSENNAKNNKKIRVIKAQLKGNTVLEKSIVSLVMHKVLNRDVTLDELEQVRYDISKLYYDAGYINSGVILPKQSFDNGLVVFVAIEGELSEVNIVGLSKSAEEKIRKDIIKGAGTPLNINKLQNNITRINALQTVDKIHAIFLPGTTPGKSILNIQITEAKNYNFIFGLDNYRSPSVGAERGFAAFQHHNLSGNLDSISLQAGLAKGMNDYSLRYDFPINRYNSKISSYYVKSDSQLIDDEIVETLDITNSTSIYGVNWKFIFPQKIYFLSDASVGLELLKNKNSIIGLDKENVLVIAGHHQFSSLNVGRDFHHEINTTLRVGQASSESIDKKFNSNSAFSLVKLKTVSVHKISSTAATLKLRTSSQLFSDSLRGLERFSMGGFYTVRGYRENTLVRDNGIVLNIEYTTRFTQLALPHLTATMFVDGANGWNNDGGSATKQLLSLGAGLNWNNRKNLSMDTFFGLPLMNKPDTSGNLQDLGFHFGVQYYL